MNVEPEYWVECLFSGNRHGLITSNLAESMNACISDARELPITQMLDAIRSKIAEWFITRRECAVQNANGVTEIVETKLDLRMKEVLEQELNATKVDSGLYEVRDNGKLMQVTVGDTFEESNCSCGKWKREGIPCMHALTVLRQHGSRGHSHCSELHSSLRYASVYKGRVFGVDDVVEKRGIVEPPLNKPPPGRPAKVRGQKGRRPTAALKRRTIEVQQQEPKPKESRKCSLCGIPGHNKATCLKK
ncbi:hypothetical protein GEMRC1_014186 [Eukaryota sp. GEM-RC1]